MTKRTKKIGISGKYGARYGVKIRKQVSNIEKQQRASHQCPRCKYKQVKRVSTGIWKCRHCDLTFASGAYIPREFAIEEPKKEQRLPE
ncbi:MAG: 50S ribosomal protein L37ae [Thermoplasmata archaeon]|nr:MAG: 50S ribosomal protein L37ae [Thermoplasmata archaeon]